MMLNEVAPPAATPVPVREFAAHLRMGSGFEDDGAEDAVLDMYLRAATAAVEARIGKALISRSVILSMTQWPSGDLALPLTPVGEVEAARVFDALGDMSVTDGAAFALNQDRFAARLAPRSGTWPTIPVDGRAEIAFRAGFGPDANAIPPDLRQAVLLLAATYYEDRRGGGVGGAEMPFAILSLLQAYRRVRVS